MGPLTAPVEPSGQAAPPDVASRWSRLGGFVADIVVLTVVTGPLLVPAALARLEYHDALEKAAADPTAQGPAALPFWTSEWFLSLVLAVVFAIYRVPQVAGFGRTLGHRIFGVRVVTFTGASRVGFGRALLRYLLFYGINVVPVLGPIVTFVSYVWCLFDKPYRQCLHDKAAGTYVVSTRRRQPPAPAPAPQY